MGRVKLYLLDSNIPQNGRADHREITNQLYGGDLQTRIRQEIVFGIGGLRALKELGVRSDRVSHERGPFARSWPLSGFAC